MEKIVLTTKISKYKPKLIKVKVKMTMKMMMTSEPKKVQVMMIISKHSQIKLV